MNRMLSPSGALAALGGIALEMLRFPADGKLASR